MALDFYKAVLLSPIAYSLGRIYLEHFIDQVYSSGVHPLWESHFSFKNQLEGLVIMKRLERNFTSYELKDYAAEGPNIPSWGRYVFLKHLRADIEWSPNKSCFSFTHNILRLLLCRVLPVLQFTRIPEVNLYNSVDGS
jgi:hypothetical protein